MDAWVAGDGNFDCAGVRTGYFAEMKASFVRWALPAAVGCVILRALLAAWLLASARIEYRGSVELGALDSLYWLAGGLTGLALWDCRAGRVARRWARRKRVLWSLLLLTLAGVFLGTLFGVEKGLSDAILRERMKPLEKEIRAKAILEFVNVARDDPYSADSVDLFAPAFYELTPEDKGKVLRAALQGL